MIPRQSMRAVSLIDFEWVGTGQVFRRMLFVSPRYTMRARTPVRRRSDIGEARRVRRPPFSCDQQLCSWLNSRAASPREILRCTKRSQIQSKSGIESVVVRRCSMVFNSCTVLQPRKASMRVSSLGRSASNWGVFKLSNSRTPLSWHPFGSLVTHHADALRATIGSPAVLCMVLCMDDPLP